MKKLTSGEYLHKYLLIETLSLAVHRAIEAKNISQIIMQKPILDLGCGYGEFTQVFFEDKIDIGVDISQREIENAKKTNKYEKLVRADARDLPFPDNFFATVISISTLEHIEGVEKVISEVFRILKPKGIFVFTVNTDKINEFLFWPRVFRRLGLQVLADIYPRLYNRVFNHKTLLNKRTWRDILQKNHFEVVKMREILSPEATKHFDKFLITAWPAQLGKFLTGRRWVWRPRLILDWLVKRYSHHVEKREKEGSNLFVVAVKGLA